MNISTSIHTLIQSMGNADEFSLEKLLAHSQFILDISSACKQTELYSLQLPSIMAQVDVFNAELQSQDDRLLAAWMLTLEYITVSTSIPQLQAGAIFTFPIVEQFLPPH